MADEKDYDPKKDFDKDGDNDEKDKKLREQDLNKDGKVTDDEREAWRATQPDRVSRDVLAQRYGYALDVLYSNDELKDLFLRAFNDDDGQWTAERFVAELKGTNWWANGEYWRKAWVMREEGIEWDNQLRGAKQVILDRAAGFGVQLTDDQLNKLATRYLFEGWYDGPRGSLLDNELSKLITGTSVGSTDYRAQLRALAYEYGVEKLLDDSWYQNALQRLARKDTSMDALTADIRKMAISKYAPLASSIENGQTTRSALKGYTSSMSQILELDETKIDLEDPILKQAYMGPAGQDGSSLMTLFDFETLLRKDPRWQKTMNGRQTTLNAAQGFLQSLGFVG